MMHVSFMHVFMMHVSKMHFHMMHLRMMPWCMYARFIYLWPLILMHMCMMHVSLILGLDVCRFDACVYDAYISMILEPSYDGYIYDSWPLTLIMMDISMILDPWPWCMYVWWIYLWSLILMHVCMMQVWMIHISMIFYPDTCIYDAGLFPDQRTDEQGDSRSWMCTYQRSDIWYTPPAVFPHNIKFACTLVTSHNLIFHLPPPHGSIACLIFWLTDCSIFAFLTR